jgi:hypothetical protein
VRGGEGALPEGGGATIIGGRNRREVRMRERNEEPMRAEATTPAQPADELARDYPGLALRELGRIEPKLQLGSPPPPP